MHELAVTPALSVSFQRYPYPPDGFVDALPTSCGALPLLVLEARRAAVASPAGEAFWVGLIPRFRGAACQVRLVATLALGGDVDLAAPDGSARVLVERMQTVIGIVRSGDTWWPLARTVEGSGGPACRRLRVDTWPATFGDPPSGEPEASVRVDLLDPDTFENLGGERVGRLDSTNRYKGWRLP